MKKEPAESPSDQRAFAKPGLWDASLFSLCIALVGVFAWAHAEERLSIFLGLPRYAPDVSPLLSELRSNFVRGVVSGVQLLLYLGVACLAKGRMTRRGLIVVPLGVFGGDVLKALLIFWTCGNLTNDSGIPEAWSARGTFTLHNVQFLILMLLVFGVVVWGGARQRALTAEVRRKSVPNPHVEQLDLSGLPVTDAKLEEIGRITMLRALWLSDTKVADSGLAHLKGLTSLEELYLDNTLVTDGGLSSLSGLLRLKLLSLRATQVTDEGIARLKAALPKLDVAR